MLNIHYTYDTHIPGPHILVLGSIHGDEVCGSLAIERIITRLHTGDIQLLCGSLTLLPYANPLAYTAGKRYIQYNLNRIFADAHTHSDEHAIAKNIKTHIDTADFVLDLHSFSSDISPFVFDDFGTVHTHDIIKNLPVEYVMTGWPDLYVDDTSMDTIGYAKSKGKYGITIECGAHTDTESISVSEKCILSVLGSLYMIAYTVVPYIHQKWIHVSEKIHRKNGDIFSREWKNFDYVHTGESLVHRDTGYILAPTDGYIIMPNADAKIGDEWIYFGT